LKLHSFGTDGDGHANRCAIKPFEKLRRKSMPSNKLKRDPDADVAALISVLRNEPNQVFECIPLPVRSDVPKSLIRGLLTGHPNVNIIEGPKKKFKYQYRA
jgi:hypothetical protein|tara:strand:- start:166 stop:468 length:303 start_codon:yes stop_codon:yes gene_type:complete